MSYLVSQFLQMIIVNGEIKQTNFYSKLGSISIPSCIDKVWDVYQAIRTVFGDPRGGFSYYKLPEVVHFHRDDEEDIDNYKAY